MAYQEYDLLTTSTLFSSLSTFAAANGFTAESTITGPGGDYHGDMYVLSKTVAGGSDTMYWWFLAKKDYDSEFHDYGLIEMRMQITAPTLANRELLYAGGVEGQKNLTRCHLFGKYQASDTFLKTRFYADSGAIHCVIELTSNVFTHFSFGNISKFGTWVGGEYLSGSDMPRIDFGYSGGAFDELYTVPIFGGTATSNEETGYLYYPYETKGTEEDWSAFHLGTGLTESRRTVAPMDCNYPTNYLSGLLYNQNPNAFNSRSAQLPLYLFVYDNRSGGTQKDILVGEIPNARLINMTEIDPKETVNTDWDVYPIHQKIGDSAVTPVTGNVGVTYRKIT